MAKQTKNVDWQAVKDEYEAGILSLRHIGSNVGIDHAYICRVAKREGWIRDLSKRVRKAVTRKIVTDGDSVDSPAREKAIVEAAAIRSFEVIKSHRRDIGEQRDIIRNLLVDLKDEKTCKVIAFRDGKTAPVGLSVIDKAGVVRDLANATARLIPLERQAYGLNGAESDEDAPRSISLTIIRADQAAIQVGR